jgi:hypothetical protein
MKNKQTIFFAILPDMEPILKNIEAAIDIHYFKTGFSDSRNILHYNSILEMPNFGFTLFGDWNRIDSYLVMPKKEFVNVRTVSQRSGDPKFAVDQLINERSIEFKPGGIYSEKGNVIVAGRISTVSEDEFSNETFKIFSSRIKKDFKKIGSFYVGNNAVENLKLGWRLVINEKSPKEYDLKI